MRSIYCAAVLLLASSSHAYLAGGVARCHRCAVQSCAPPLAAQLPRSRAAIIACDAAAAAPEPAPEPTSALGKTRAWFSKWAKFDRATLSKLGVDFLFTYGVVSNLNVALTASLAFAAFATKNGRSPLAAGAKAGFLVEYAIIYATLGTLLRPVRMALAVSATPLYSRAVGKLRSSLPFYESRPKLNRTIALFLMSVLLNVFASGLLAAFGCYIASIITGVSFFPPPV